MQKVHTSQLSRLGSQDSHPHFHTGQGGRPLQLKESNQNSNMAQLPRTFGIDQVGMPPNPQNWANPHHFKRSETQIDPATAHLQHFGNPYFRKQKSSYAEIRHSETTNRSPTYGIQLQPMPASSGHNFFAQPQNSGAQQEQKKRGPMFDDDDLSIFLDQRYKMLEKKDVQLNGTLNLDDSMVQDLNTLNVLLKAKPH